MKFLTIANFDPTKVNIDFLDVVGSIPASGYMDGPMSEQLATTTLIASDKIIDLLAQAVLYEAHCEAQRRSMKATVINDLLENKRPSTVVKEIFADDPRYTKVANDYNMALAWKGWLENKHSTLLKTHHLCKDLMKKAEAQLGNAGWTPAISTKVQSNTAEDSWSSESVNTAEPVKITSNKVGKSSWNV